MFSSFNEKRATRRPPNAPPNFTPTKGQGQKLNFGGTPSTNQGVTTFAVDPGAIFPCINRFVYIWPTNGPGFWAYVTFVGPRSVAGWRFGRGRVRYFGMDLRRIDEFYCV